MRVAVQLTAALHWPPLPDEFPVLPRRISHSHTLEFYRVYADVLGC